MDVREAGSLWEPEGIYLNTASYGLPPRPTTEAMDAVLDDWRHGRTSWEPWGNAVEVARATFARLVQAKVEDVAIGATVSGFVGLIAGSLPDDCRVVIPDAEFASALFPFYIQGRRGVEVDTVPLRHLAEAIDDRTAAVCVSVVQSATGEVADLDAIEEAAREHGALTIVDATQACGWYPIDASRFDFLVCHAYKWLLSPRGTAFMVIDPSRRDQVESLTAGWYSGEDIHEYYGPPLRLATSARRFDLSPAWFSWVGTEASLKVIEEVGVDRIHDHDVGLANRFRAGLGLEPGPSAIVAVELPDAGPRLERAGVRAAVRAGKLRVSFHVYNTEDDVDATLRALRD